MIADTLSARESADRRQSPPNIAVGRSNQVLLGVDRNAYGEYLIVPATGGQPESLTVAADSLPQHGTDGHELTPSQLLPVVREVSRLAIALSEASFRQGQLEEQVRQFDARATEAAGREQAAHARADQSVAEADDLRRQLRDALVRLRAPWWRRLLGT